MSTRYIIISVIFLSLSLGTAAGAQEDIGLADRLFLELWNDNAYSKTEFGADEPGYKEEDFYISRLWLQTGLRYELAEDIFFDPHLVVELVGDWGSEEWNNVYWSNGLFWGFGARLSYETSSDGEEGQVLWLSDFNVEVFADLMFSEDSLDNGKDNIPAEVSTDNLKTGFSLWAAVDTQECFSGLMSGWAEIYGELTYESTGFAEEGSDNFYLFTLEVLVGPQFPFNDIYLQPYYALNVIRDFGDESWNKEPWLNNYTYGPGVRLSMGSLIPVENADLYLYVEYLEIDYMSRVDEELYADTADDDLRIGIQIYLPFGATQDRIRRH